MEKLSEKICRLKHDFISIYSGNSHTTEILPKKPSLEFQINENSLVLLHSFLENNPIYSTKFESMIKSENFLIFEGDLNNYWIDSIKHDTSYAPFYPTWMLSAFCLAEKIKELKTEQIFDIGSGDGRIAFCGKIMGLDSISVEIDENLVNLQNDLVRDTGIRFHPTCSDATIFDFDEFEGKKSAFVIGGVPEIGEILAESVIDNVLKHEYFENSIFVLTGSHAKQRFSKSIDCFGWGNLVKKFDLDIITTENLPTYWTMDQEFETPYVFLKKDNT
tara:strand:+ start:926 stop:1750 length:825 start_codon:yes stop_codon:yes gene_type:complete